MYNTVNLEEFVQKSSGKKQFKNIYVKCYHQIFFFSLSFIFYFKFFKLYLVMVHLTQCCLKNILIHFFHVAIYEFDFLYNFNIYLENRLLISCTNRKYKKAVSVIYLCFSMEDGYVTLVSASFDNKLIISVDSEVVNMKSPLKNRSDYIYCWFFLNHFLCTECILL